jgi:hypothetical protein
MPRSPDEHERTLDDEGIPDLEGPLPGKAATGDPQEGLAPPNEKPRASVDKGVTSEEQRRPESIGERVDREQPDVGEAPSASDREVVIPVAPQVTRDDDEKDEVADEARSEGALSPEEAALHVERG